MKTTDFINENFVADAAEAHQDHEVQMARADCYNAAKYAIELHKLLKHISEQEGLEGWVSEKITLANDYLRTVTEYLRYEQQTGASDMPEFDIGSATQTLDAVLGEGLLDVFKGKEVKKPARVADEPGKVSFSDLGKNSVFDPNDKRNSDDQRVFYEFMLSQKNKSKPDDFINALQHYIRKYKEAARKEGGNNPHNSGRLKVLSYLESQMAATQNYRDTWQTLTGPQQGTATQPVAEEEQLKRKPAVVKTNKPIGSRIADIGPGGKEYNVKTDKAWDDQHKQEQGVEEGKADPVGSWVVYDGSKVKRFKSREGAKAYAEKNGGKVASSEHYHDKIQKQSVAETAGGMGTASVATSMGGGNGFVNGGPGTITRPTMKTKKKK